MQFEVASADVFSAVKNAVKVVAGDSADVAGMATFFDVNNDGLSELFVLANDKILYFYVNGNSLSSSSLAYVKAPDDHALFGTNVASWWKASN